MGNTIQNTLNDVKETTKEDMIEISHTISGTGERLAKTGTYITGLFPSLFDKTHSVVVGTTNFMLGGIDVLIPRDFSLYYPKLHQWVALDPLVENLQHGKIFMHKNRVILIGIRSKKWKIFAYDCQRYYWSELQTNDAPPIRFGCSIVQYNDHLIVWGGGYKGSINYVDILHLETLHWAQSPPTTLPGSREYHTAVTYKNYMVVFAGFQINHVRLYFNDLLFLNLSNMEWFQIPGEGDVPPARSGHSACVIDDSMFVFGGSNEMDHTHVKYFNDLHRLDLTTMKWKLLNTGVVPSKRCDAAIVATPEGWIHLSGGFNEQGKICSDLWTWNQSYWYNRYFDIPSPRFQHSMLYSKSGLYFYGGTEWVESEFQSKQDLYFIQLKRWVGLDVYFGYYEPATIEGVLIDLN